MIGQQPCSCAWLTPWPLSPSQCSALDSRHLLLPLKLGQCRSCDHVRTELGRVGTMHAWTYSKALKL